MALCTFGVTWHYVALLFPRAEFEDIRFDGWCTRKHDMTSSVRRGGNIFWVNIPLHGKHFTIQRFARGNATEFHLRGRSLWGPAERLGVSIVPPPKKMALEGCLCVVTYRIYTNGYSLEVLSFGTLAVAETVEFLEDTNQVRASNDECDC